MDPLLGPARPESEPGSGSGSSDPPGITTTVSGMATQPGEGSAQTMLDAWLQQLQTDQTEEPVVESRLDIDSLFSSQLEFDLDFLTELSSLKGAGSGDGGVSLQELSQDLELGLFYPPGALLEPDPVDLGALSGSELFPEQPPASAAPESTSTRPGPAAAFESTTARPAAGERPGSDSGSAPPRPPPVASISVVTNKQRGKTVITISTPRGRQSFVLPTADLTQASRVLRALQQKRRRNRASAAAAVAEAEPEDAVKVKDEDSVKSPAASSRRRSTEAPAKRKKSHSDAKDDDDPVMSEALRHLGFDLTQLEMDRNGESKAVVCPEPGCDMTTVNMFKLKVHILQHRNYKPYKCSEEGCKWEFFERGKLNRHEATHTQASLKCGEPGCPGAFRTRTNLQRHRLRIHGLSTAAPPPPSQPAPPPSQPAPPPSQPAPPPPPADSAAQHTYGADEGDPLTPALYRCTFCDRVFKMAAGLKRHLNWHEKQSVSACTHPGCGFTAPGLQQLKLHERRHAEKQYRCTYPECSWAFESHAKLKRHLSQHTGRRNFRCPYIGCEKSYRRMEYLSSHIRLHLGRYYQCPQRGCRLRFTHQFSLATHIRSVHDVPSMAADPASSSPASVTCPMCDARFKSEIYRQIHLQDVHGTSSSKLLQPQSSARDEEEFDARKKKKSKFNPESLNWVEDGDPGTVDDGQTYTVYVPFEVETDSGPSEVLVKCDVTEDECRRLGIELGPEAGSGDAEQPPAAYDHVLADNNSAKDTARELRRMGIGVLPAGLRRTAHSGCARTDITSCHLAVRRSRPRPRRPPTGRQRRPGGWPRKHADRAGAAGVPSPYDPDLVMEPIQVCRTVLDEPPSLLCDSDLLGSVHDQLQHSTINLSDLT